MQVLPISANSLLVRAYNPLVALMIVSFFALAIRYFILRFSERSRGVAVNAFRLVVETLFLVLGWLYALFVTPQLTWDRPARIASALPAVGLLLWIALRHRQQRAAKPPSRNPATGVVRLICSAVLIFAATLTIIRAGYIALLGDRVTLLVDVTGEIKNQRSFSIPEYRQRNPCQALLVAHPEQRLLVQRAWDTLPKETFTLHHVIIWLPTGEAAADVWIIGDEFAIVGRAIRFSPTLHSLKVPNLYALRYVCNGSFKAEPPNTYTPEVIEIPGRGSLKVHAWWRAVQSRLLIYWSRHVPGDSWLAIQTALDESPYYPLVDADGKPIHKIFLLVLRPSAVSTSRGSSPLEGKQTPFK